MALMSSAPGFDNSVIAVGGVGFIRCEIAVSSEASNEEDDEDGQDVSCCHLVSPVSSVMRRREFTATWS